MSDTHTTTDFTDPAAMHAVRALSGRLAHDFNKLITPLLAYPQLIRKELSSGASSLALLDVMESTAEDIARICRQLARLGPEPQALPARLDLKPLIETVVRDLQQEAQSRGVMLSLATESDLPSVWMGEPQFTGMLQSLIRNGIDAAEGRPSAGVSVAVGRHTVEQSRAVAGGTMPPGSYVRIDVTDDGVGIPEDFRSRIFDPLVTTNRRRKVRGSGLGLSIVYAMLADARGFIAFESEPDQGTTFSLYLPEHTGDATVAEPLPVEFVKEEAPLAARILVCDDEHVIVKLFQMIIRSGLKGVEVDEARNGEEALKRFRERRHQVVVMDLHMPVMDGQTAFHAIQSYCGEAGCEMPTVIFCTGYAPPEGVRRLAESGSRHALLLKPVNTQVLVEAVRSGLRGGHGSHT